MSMSSSKVSDWEPSQSFFYTLRAGILLLVCSMHIALIIISALALLLGSGGGSQISVIVFGSITLLLVAFFSLIQRFNPIPDKALGQSRRLIFFPCIVGFSVGVFIVLVARIPGSKLASDYASLGDLSSLVLVLGLFTALFACMLPVLYPFYNYNNRPTTYFSQPERRAPGPPERAVDVFEVETLPPFPSPLPIVYVDVSGRWTHMEHPGSRPGTLAPVNQSVPRQISSDPFFDISLYDVGKFPDGGPSFEERTQWPAIERYANHV